MKPEDRALLIVLVAVVVAAAGGAAYFLLAAGSVPQSLPIPAGTTFTANESEQWVAHFTVGAAGGRLVGGWTAYDGSGGIYLVVVNGTVSKPWPPPPLMCPLILSWGEINGTIDLPVGPGPHTAYWSTGYCSAASRIVVTRTIQVLTP